MRIRPIVAAAGALLAAALPGCEITTCTFYDLDLGAPSCGQGVNLNSAPEVTNLKMVARMDDGTRGTIVSPRVDQLIEFSVSAIDRDRDQLFYEWDFDGDGEYEKTGSVPLATWRYSGHGLVTARVRVSDFPRHDGGEGSGTASRSFRVHTREQYDQDQAPVPRLTVDPPQVEVGQRVRFDGSASTDPDGPVQFGWSHSGDGEYGNFPVIHVSWSEPGEKFVSLFVTDEYGKSSYTRKPVQVVPRTAQPGPAPQPHAVLDIAPNPADVGGNVAFGATNSTPGTGAIATYDWDLDGEPGYELRTTSSITHRTYSEPHEVLPVSVRVTDEAGRSDTAEATLRVLPGGGPTAVLGIDPNPAHVGETVSFTGYGSTDPDGDIAVYQWDLDGVPGYEQETSLGYVERTYGSVGEFDVFLRVVDGAGRSSVTSRTMRVIAAGGGGLRASAAVKYGRVRAFSGSLDGTAERARLRATIGGTKKLSRAERALKLFLGSGWKVVDLDRGRANRAAGQAKVSALVLAKAPRRRGTVCIRLGVTVRARQLPEGTFKVLGGTGAGERLYATGRYRFKVEGSGPATVLGTLRAGVGKRRGLPRACS
jgi:hypothetical protein